MPDVLSVIAVFFRGPVIQVNGSAVCSGANSDFVLKTEFGNLQQEFLDRKLRKLTSDGDSEIARSCDPAFLNSDGHKL